MRITTFNPMIISNDAENDIKLFEELGFERKHKKTGINDEDISSVRMTDANGFHVDVAQVDKLPQGFATIRMNVDNFEEAIALLEKNGFKNTQGDKVTDTGSSKATMMASPSGFTISVAQHIKK